MASLMKPSGRIFGACRTQLMEMQMAQKALEQERAALETERAELEMKRPSLEGRG